MIRVFFPYIMHIRLFVNRMIELFSVNFWKKWTIDRRWRDQEIAGAQSFESNTTDEGKESKKRNSEEGEENASLSRNVDSSLYLQFFSISPFF